MRFTSKLTLLALAAVAAMAVAAPSAFATENIEIVDEATGEHCPSIAEGGCSIHGDGDAVTLTAHLFGFETREATCHNEFTMLLDENGNGQITDFLIFGAGEAGNDSNCNTLVAPCNLPWSGSGEEVAAETTRVTAAVCVDPTETTTCSGNFVIDIGESGPDQAERYSGTATDVDLGLCEVTGTYSIETSTTDSPIHINHL